MQIVSPKVTKHTIKVATRDYTGDLTMTLRDDFTKDEYNVSPTITKSNSYRSVVFNFNFEEGKWYRITLKDSTNIPVFRGKIYATEQTELDKYNILKDVYEQELGYDNKFMTL